ncbi:hypothetical protein BHM03_00013048 [Ensete ventricosum]|nr:hypothetical protein BHM03_00013048 [Ensete ventricosum]
MEACGFTVCSMGREGMAVTSKFHLPLQNKPSSLRPPSHSCPLYIATTCSDALTLLEIGQGEMSAAFLSAGAVAGSCIGLRADASAKLLPEKDCSVGWRSRTVSNGFRTQCMKVCL